MVQFHRQTVKHCAPCPYVAKPYRSTPRSSRGNRAFAPWYRLHKLLDAAATSSSISAMVRRPIMVVRSCEPQRCKTCAVQTICAYTGLANTPALRSIRHRQHCTIERALIDHDGLAGHDLVVARNEERIERAVIFRCRKIIHERNLAEQIEKCILRDV